MNEGGRQGDESETLRWILRHHSPNQAIAAPSDTHLRTSRQSLRPMEGGGPRPGRAGGGWMAAGVGDCGGQGATGGGHAEEVVQAPGVVWPPGGRLGGSDSGGLEGDRMSLQPRGI